jgi:ABC-type sugar transport system ATPase subunit
VLNPSAPIEQAAPLLAAKGLVRAFPGTLALAGVDVAIHPGSVHGLVGHNGAGKSTLVKILTGVDQPDAGTIESQGTRVVLDGPRAARRHGIAVTYQDGNYIPGIEAREFIYVGNGFPRRHGRVDTHRMDRECGELSAALEIPAWVWRRRLADLPGAARKMVAIAKALHVGAKTIILDEPTSGLPRAEVDQVLRLVLVLRDRGIGLLYVTHRLEEIEAVTNEVSVMRKGEVVAHLSTSATRRQQLVELIGGRADAAHTRMRAAGREHAQRPALELRWGDGPRRGFDVARGEVVGLTGPDETAVQGMLRCSVGLSAGSGVALRREGKAFRPSKPAKAMHRGVIYISADRLGEGGIPNFSLGRNLTLSSLRRHVRRGGLGIVNTAHERRAAQAISERVGVISHGIDQPFGELSGGNQQKALVGRAIEAGAETIVIDSPTVGVDVGARVEIYRLLQSVADDGHAVLVGSSDVDELADLCDRVVVLRDELVSVLHGEDATRERIRAAYFGTGEEQ